MAVAPAVVRGPDIIIRTAPPLSATSDGPLGEINRPPVSASNDPTDLARGVPKEMTMLEKAAADAARSAAAGADQIEDAGEPGTNPNTPAGETDDAAAVAAKKAADLDAVPDEVEVDGKKVPTPPYVKREITKARNKQRAAEALAAEREAAVKTANEAAEAARKELAELKAKAEAQPPAKVEEPAAVDLKPARDAFDDPDAYDTALTEWGVREGERKAQAKIADEQKAAREAEAQKTAEAARATQEAEVARLNADWQTKRTAAIEKYPDYADVVEAETLKISEPMAAAIMLTENGTDIAYHLGQNADVAARIAAMPNPMAQLIEIGRLSATLAAPPQRRQPRPRPIEPLDTGAAPADTSEREPSMDEWAARRMPQILAGNKPAFSRMN
jgi:hypothetical protein